MTSKRVRVRLLGAVTIESSGDPLRPGVRRLLAVLSAASGDQVSEASLVDALWGAGDGDGLPENPVRSLQTAVSRLRSALGADAIERVGDGYRLETGAVWLDVRLFEELLESARQAQGRADDRSAIEELDTALDLWRGPALGEFADEPWAQGEARRLDELRVDAQERRAEMLVGLDDVDGALIADLELLAASHPHREGPTRQLMVALHRAGRQADAIEAYQRLRRRLATDLGLEPSDAMSELEGRVLSDDSGLRVTAARALRGYELTERLGEGAFSIVYRGLQPSVGREVAIKQIRAELANRPEFVRRFEAEAHLVARLEHPHIVPLIDYWREPDSAYLVMRLLRGGSLESSLSAGPWALERTVKMITEVAGGLETAHRAGVVHRDIKPANVLLDHLGHAYLTDFGIALEAHEVADPAAALSAGSPAYASPEQLRREPATPAADVHGLGVVLYETLAGRLPFPDEPSQAALLQRQLHDPIPPLRDSRSDLPSALDAVVGKATAKRPDDRYQTIEEFVSALDSAVSGSIVEPVRRGISTALISDERNPYKGLRAFDEADVDDFAGRARLVDQFIERISSHRLLAVVGPSGSGKSSAVRAGLLPALRSGEVAGSEEWFITTMMPGASPFEELESALLRVAVSRPADLLGVLRDGDRGIARGIRHVVPAEDAQIVVVIDQFEELFTLADSAVAGRFLDALAAALTEERPHLRVVLTLRADFYDRPLRHELVGRLVKDATVAVLPLAADELEHAIIDPAATVGVEFEPGLVSRIVADVADQPGALPMLQYALTELYEHRVGGVLTLAAYSELGGVAGALGRRAEDLFVEAGHDERTAIRRMFGRLVALGETTNDTRRRALRGELGTGSTLDSVLMQFGAARLLSFDVDPQSREPTVEVAHEELLRQWARLGTWLEEDRDGLRILRRLTVTADEWERNSRAEEELYRGGRLEAAEEWWSQHRSELTEIETEFLAASITARDATQEGVRRSARRTRRLLAGVAVVAVLAVVASAVALAQRQSADRSADDARAALVSAEESSGREATARAAAEAQFFASETDRLLATSTGLGATDPRGALLLAVAGHDRDPSPESLGAIQQALVAAGPIHGFLQWGTAYRDVEWVANGRVVGVRDGALDLIDVASGQLIDTVEFSTARTAFPDFRRAATNADGTLLAVLSDVPDGIDELPDLSEVTVYEVAETLETRFTAPLAVVGITVDMDVAGDLIVATGADATSSVVRAWDSVGTEIWEPVVLPRPSSMADQVAPFFGDDLVNPSFWEAAPVGAFASVTEEMVFIHNGALLHRFDHDGTQLGERMLVRHAAEAAPRFVTEVYESERGWHLLDGASNASSFIDRADGWPVVVRHEQMAEDLSPIANLATATAMVGQEVHAVRSGGTLTVMDPDEREILSTVELHSGRPEAISVAPSKRRAVVAHSLGLTVISLDGSGPINAAIPRDASLVAPSVSADGATVLLSGVGVVTPEVWRVDDDGVVRREPGEPLGSEVLLAWMSPDSPGVITTRLPGSPTIDEIGYDVDTLEAKWVWERPLSASAETSSAETPAGPLRAMAHSIGLAVDVFRVGEWDAPLQSFEGPGAGIAGTPFDVEIWGIAIDPARHRLVAANNRGDAVMWDLATGSEIRSDFVANADIVLVAWSPDGSLLATAALDGLITIRDGETLEPLRTMAGASAPSGAAHLLFSADGTQLLTTFDGPARLWDVETGRQVGSGFESQESTNAAVNRNDSVLQLVTNSEQRALVWNLDTAAWAEIACAVAGSNLTRAEWEQWGPRDHPYGAVCRDFLVES